MYTIEKGRPKADGFFFGGLTWFVTPSSGAAELPQKAGPRPCRNRGGAGGGHPAPPPAKKAG